MNQILRGVPWPPVLVSTGVGAVFLVVFAAWPTTRVGEYFLFMGFGALACAAAYVLDEAAADVVDGVPRSLRSRTACRANALLAPVAVLVLLLGAAEAATPELPLAGLLLQGLGCVLAAFTAAAGARRHAASPGSAVGTAAALVIVGISLMNPAAKWVDMLLLDPSGRWGRTVAFWAVVWAVSAVVVSRATRDPLAGRRANTAK